MATPGNKKSTIPDARDPLATSTYNQPQPPINRLIVDTSDEKKPEAPAEDENGAEAKPKDVKPAKPPKDKVTVVVPVDLMERLRNAAYWRRETLTTLAEEGLRLVLAKLELKNGGPFEPMEKKLKRGRPQGSKNSR